MLRSEFHGSRVSSREPFVFLDTVVRVISRRLVGRADGRANKRTNGSVKRI